MTVATTPRLILRRWRASDREPFARMNGDPRVMEFFPGLLTREESDQAADRIQAHFEKHGFGLCAAEVARDGCVHRVYRPGCSVIRGPFHSLRGDWLAPGGRVLGARPGHRRRSGNSPLRVRGGWPRRTGLHDRPCESALPARDGEARHDSESSGRFRPPQRTRGPSAAPPHLVSSASH